MEFCDDLIHEYFSVPQVLAHQVLDGYLNALPLFDLVGFFVVRLPSVENLEQHHPDPIIVNEFVVVPTPPHLRRSRPILELVLLLIRLGDL